MDTWRLINLAGMTTLLFVLVYRASKSLGYPIPITWGYFLLRALLVFENPLFHGDWSFHNSNGVSFKLPTQLDQTAGQAFAQLLLIPLVVFVMPKRHFRYWQTFFLGIGLIETYFMLNDGEALMGASSFDSAFIAALMPFTGVYTVGPFLLSIVLSARAATAVMILGTATAAGLVAHFKNWKAAVLTLVSMALFIWFCTFLPSLHGLSSAGRVPAWIRFMEWWKVEASWTFGTGIGTFQWIGPAIDGLEGSRLFMHMHNDWLQILFEGGVLGLLLAVSSFGFLLWRSWNRPKLFAAVVGLGVFALTYHPLRFFPTALFIACVVREILLPINKEPTSNNHT